MIWLSKELEFALRATRKGISLLFYNEWGRRREKGEREQSKDKALPTFPFGKGQKKTPQGGAQKDFGEYVMDFRLFTLLGEL